MNNSYQVESTLSAEEFIDVQPRSGLTAGRPVDDHHRVEGMVQNSNVIVTARDREWLVGVPRSHSRMQEHTPTENQN
jgi:hypothetical protein